MDQFWMKRGDTAPALRYDLLPSSISLAGASVVFNLSGSTPILSRVIARIVSDSPPSVEFGDWEVAQPIPPGRYRAEFEVTYADGKVETFPNQGFIPVIIYEDLG